MKLKVFGVDHTTLHTFTHYLPRDGANFWSPTRVRCLAPTSLVFTISEEGCAPRFTVGDACHYTTSNNLVAASDVMATVIKILLGQQVPFEIV